jgi:hypothetical protein
MDHDELSGVRQAVEEVSNEVLATLVGGIAVGDRSPEVERVTEYITAHEWADSASLLETTPDPGAMLARLTVATPPEPARHSRFSSRPSSRQEGAPWGEGVGREPRVMRWLATTLEHWIVDPAYATLVSNLSLEDLRSLFGGRTPSEQERLARTAPMATARLALALAGDPDVDEAMLGRIAEIAAHGAQTTFAKHMREASRLLRLAARAPALSAADRVGWQNTLISLAQSFAHFDSDDMTEQALDQMLGDEQLRRLLDGFEGLHLSQLAKHSPAVFRVLGNRFPDRVAQQIAIWWATPESRSYLHVMSDSDVKAILEAAPDPVRQRLVSNAARDIVLGKMKDKELIDARRWIAGHPDANSALRLWQFIALWDSARDPSARDGTEQQVCDVARADPTLWVRTLPALLSDPTWWQLLVPPTLLLHRDAHVRRALHELAETGPSPIASRALSLSRMVEGREAPGASEYESLIGLIASERDGYTIFPHPLALASATWVGSRGVEDALRRLVSDACDRFAKRVPKQLGLDEEQHTRDLLRDLEDSLGRLADSPWIVRSHTGPATPEIIIDYRQESKRAEKTTGVDVAFLVDIDIPGALRLTSAELVQVKKPRRDNSVFSDKWRIEIQQLNDLIAASPSAVYLLISTNGALHVVPAKFLLGLVQARTVGEDLTVGYNQMRGAVIQFSQFLIDLLLGLWVGSTDRAVTIARGTDPFLTPLNLVTIRLGTAQIDGDQPRA